MIRLPMRGGLWRLLAPAIGDILIFFAALALALWARDPALLRTETFLSFAPMFLSWLGVFYALGLYEMWQVRDFVALIGNLAGSILLCGAAGVTYFYLFSPYNHHTPKTHLLLTVLLSHVAVLGWRRLWLALINFQLLNQKLVFLGAEMQVREIEEAVNRQGHLGFSPVNWTGEGVDMVVADAEWVEDHWSQAKAVFLAAVKHGVPVISLSTFYESLFGKVSPFDADRPTWALAHVLPHTNGFYSKTKRAFDVAASVFLLILLAPLLALIASLVFACCGRPIFYGQRRLGYLGRPFTVHKFRTMERAAEKDGPFTSAKEETDTRITRLGRVLRRFRLDELPQLWNVLRGEMSLIGPRPEWVLETEVLAKRVPNYHLRHLVMPGITGWAQVYFRATNNVNDSLEKLHYDLYYVKNFSFALDFTILLKTFKRVLISDSRVSTPRAPSFRVREITDWAGEVIARGE